MPRATATVSFQAIELKGSLLPASLLEQVARLHAPMQKEADYGLAKGERLREQIDAAWVRLKEIWEEYRDLRERAAQSTAGQHLAQSLLREVLGWQDLQPCSGWQHGDSHYPITHRAFAEPQAHTASSQGSVPLILRGIPADQLDKGSSAFGQEGRRRSPHSCLQECLNADDSANWGLLLSGDRLRLLHDNPSLVKPAYLQVDLELLVEGELFDEFATLWLLLHASRFRHPQTGGCVLDSWKEQAQEAGERVLGQLRHGVQQALEALGNGLLQHPANDELRGQLASGELSGAELHRQLLRLVYRLLFLFTAEDRDLLFPRTIRQDDPRRRIYREGYSVGRLRELAIRRSASEGPYGDLWQTQKLVFLQLRQSSSPLGLPGLGGLFAEPQCQALEACELGNRFLLRAMRAIGWFQAGDTLTRVNYRDLNTEELGSVYEGLLELHPQLERSGASWQLSYGDPEQRLAGSDRKTTGSYYTPDQLVQLLIVSALLPVIADRLSKATTREEKEEALLAIRVLDPACGSGHFLLAAARRLALELARIRAEDEEPSEELRQQCLRDVVAQCIYGVDKNPMAVELCKVALWIEAIEPGKPLSFLDAHIQCGDSLVGVFDPKVLEQGIPDEAYKPLTGDNKTVCTSLKKENASYRKASKGSSGGLQGSFNLSGAQPSSKSQNRLHEIEAMPEDSLAESTAKQEAYASWLQEAGSDPEQLAADLYTAAFFLPKTADTRACVPTTEHLLKLQLGKPLEDEALIQAVIQASRDFRFFHWHLRFGEVMGKRGFDCVLGNPPWERIKLQEKEFFAARSEAIATAANKAARESLIQALRAPDASEADRALVREFELAKREAEGSGEFIRGSGRFALTAVGDLNTYALFAEHFLNLIGPNGRAGLIVPTGIATDNSTKAYFDEISGKGKLESLISFENEAFIFREVHHAFKFCVLTLREAATQNTAAQYCFYIRHFPQLSQANRFFSLSAEDITLLNPNTRNCPAFRSQMDAELTKKIYSRIPILIDEERGSSGNPWGLKPRRLLDMAKKDVVDLCERSHSTGTLPVYEAKLMHQYDHRWATYGTDGRCQDASREQKDDPDFSVASRYWLSKSKTEETLLTQDWKNLWIIAWRDISRSTDERTVIATVIPRRASDFTLRVNLSLSRDANQASCLLAAMNSLVFDFIARQKLGGTHMADFILKQLPTPDPEMMSTKSASLFVTPRVLELTYTSHDLKPWAQDLGYDGPPFRFDPERRALLRAELDAYYAHLYGLSRDELRYILDPSDLMGPDYPSETFRVLKTNELRQFGEYRTQRLVLEAWDRLFG
jgi:hypothetical protein